MVYMENFYQLLLHHNGSSVKKKQLKLLFQPKLRKIA